MKKIYLMLIALVCLLIPAQAAVVIDLSQLSNDKVFTLRTERAFLMYSSKVSTKIASSTGKLVGSVKQNPKDVNQQFKIENINGKYYLYSVGAGKYVSTGGAYSSTPGAELFFSITNNANYIWKLCVGNQGLNTQVEEQNDAGILVDEGKFFLGDLRIVLVHITFPPF